MHANTEDVHHVEFVLCFDAFGHASCTDSDPSRLVSTAADAKIPFIGDLPLPGLLVKAGLHDPEITFARHDYAYDATQTFFGNLAGFDADELLTLIDLNEAQIEAGGVTLFSYISPGDAHTVLGKPEFYTEALNGLLLRDWVAALVAGTPVEDVHCTECN